MYKQAHTFTKKFTQVCVVDYSTARPVDHPSENMAMCAEGPPSSHSPAVNNGNSTQFPTTGPFRILLWEGEVTFLLG
jgi:hypothetical protein